MEMLFKEEQQQLSETYQVLQNRFLLPSELMGPAARQPFVDKGNVFEREPN